MKPRRYHIDQVTVLRRRIEVLEAVVEEGTPEEDSVPEGECDDGHRQHDSLILVKVRKVHRLHAVEVADRAHQDA